MDSTQYNLLQNTVLPPVAIVTGCPVTDLRMASRSTMYPGSSCPQQAPDGTQHGTVYWKSYYVCEFRVVDGGLTVTDWGSHWPNAAERLARLQDAIPFCASNCGTSPCMGFVYLNKCRWDAEQ